MINIVNTIRKSKKNISMIFLHLFFIIVCITLVVLACNQIAIPFILLSFCAVYLGITVIMLPTFFLYLLERR